MRHRWVIQLCGGLMVAVTVVIFFSLDIDSIVGWSLYMICMIATLLVGQRLQRDNKRELTIMWTLADEIGYTAADLKRLSGKYGEVDWALTRPEHMDFFPGIKVIKTVTRKMQIEQGERALETSHQQ
ncbi:hypothetical protein [Lacticaseibacillus porcinae]|uniref:hypothetical protein n=1 Tax=Lacticaseibacillus porcinae TaxID=1123687 RepID=UPI000F775A1B|nr:hypothetical protein [Lacticaseibacillus porcinae]